jgi:hypothetical protein
MTDSNKPQQVICDIADERFVYLALAYIDGISDAEELDELAEFLQESHMREAFVALCIHTRQMAELGGFNISSVPGVDSSCGQINQHNYNLELLCDEDRLWQALAEDERNAVGVELQESGEQLLSEHPAGAAVKIVPAPRRVSRLSLYTAVVSTAALFLIMAYVFYNPKVAPPVVAKLTELIETEWSSPSTSLAEGSDLRAEPMKLLQGYAEIRFDDGAEVILQGPVEIKLEASDRISLLEGRLYAYVPAYATGFVVQTPQATVVDYGTEFAMSVSKSGTTEAHVFTGRIELRSGPELIKHGPSTLLSEKDAARVDDSGKVSRITVQPHQFVKRVPSSYELAVRRTNPKAYWRFEDCTEGRFFNATNHGSYSGQYFNTVKVDEEGPWLGRGIRAHSLVFDGRDGYAAVPGITAQDLSSGAYSVVLWARPDEPGGQNIITSSDVRGPDYNHSLQIRMDEKGRFEFYVFSDEELEYTLTGEVAAQAGRWYHIGATLSSSGNMSLFIDGKAAGTSKMKGFPIKTYDHVYIGSPAGNDPQAHWEEHSRDAFKGAVAEVAIYGRALPPPEIRTLYSSAK